MLLKNFKYVDRLEFLVERNNYDVKRLKNVINIAERCYKTFVTNIWYLEKPFLVFYYLILSLLKL